MYILIVLMSVSLLVGIGIWGYAYHLGLRHGRATSVPFRLINELLDHKIYCRAQDPSAARLELETSLAIEAWESHSLVQHVLHTPRHAPSNEDDTNSASVHKTKRVA